MAIYDMRRMAQAYPPYMLSVLSLYCGFRFSLAQYLIGRQRGNTDKSRADKLAPSAACYTQPMPNYRRNRIPGGTYFFTVNLLERKSQFLVNHIEELRTAVRITRQQHAFHIDAWVVLPDHLHCIWTLPMGDDDYSNRWRAIKKAFSKSIPRTEYRSKVRQKRNERGIWQRRFWEDTIRNDADYAAHMDYIHFNPVKHGWVKAAKEWPFSTFHSLVKKDIYPIDWADFNNDSLDVGERK